MSPAARDYYERRFLPAYREMLRAVQATPLTVLVWGPGPDAADLYAKRLHIRDELRRDGIAAVFSEEIDIQVPGTGVSAKMRELLQALSADLIVVLQSSPGSIAETHDFAEFVRDVGSKLMVFIDAKAVDGYSYTGALAELQVLFHNVHTYTAPQDLTECNLLAAVREVVRVLRHLKWRTGLR
jgi:hypothetical protein